MKAAPDWYKRQVTDDLADLARLPGDQYKAVDRIRLTLWRTGGSIELDDCQLAAIAGISLRVWKRIRRPVLRFFTVADNMISDPKLAKLRQNIEEVSAKKRSAGVAGGNAKALKTNSTGLAYATRVPGIVPRESRSQNLEKREKEEAAAAARASRDRSPPLRKGGRRPSVRDGQPEFILAIDGGRCAASEPDAVPASTAGAVPLKAVPSADFQRGAVQADHPAPRPDDAGAVPPFLTPPSPADGGHRIRLDRLDEMLRAAAGNVPDPDLSLAFPLRWLAAGCSLDLDILPTLRAVAARPRSEPIKVWKYFNDAVMAARNRRLSLALDSPGVAGELVDQQSSNTQASREPTSAEPPSLVGRLPPGWTPDDSDMQAALAEGLTVEEAEREAERFRNHWLSMAGSRAIRASWPHAWRNWVMEAADRKRGTGSRAQAGRNGYAVLAEELRRRRSGGIGS